MSISTGATGVAVDESRITASRLAMPEPARDSWSGRRLGILGAVWALLIMAGMFSMWNYASTPGMQRTPPRQWPFDTALPRTGNQPTLLLFAHPHCPCTRASMAEFERIIAQCQGKLDATVVFLKPTRFAAGWEQAELWRMAEQIPGVHICRDDGGVETSRFKADVSGMTLLYDTSGNLLFRGGITSARGHEGVNAGRLAVISLVNSGAAGHCQTPVFGCPLDDAETSRCNRQEICRLPEVPK